MSVSEFVDQWREDSVPEGRNGSTHVVRGKPLLYLKDWHFVKVQVEITIYHIFLKLLFISLSRLGVAKELAVYVAILVGNMYASYIYFTS